jgi:hypothetical protein
MAISLLDPDPPRSASVPHMAAQLIAPLAAGARESSVPVDGTGVANVGWETRDAVLLVRLARSLDQTKWRVTAQLPGAAGLEPVAEFAPWSEEGATVAVYRPLPPAGGSVIAPFTVTFGLTEVDRAGVETAVPANEIATRLKVIVLEGILGGMLHLLGAEKARIRRVGRELAAMRGLEAARDHALDSHGADLGVPRFGDRLIYDAATGSLALDQARESDRWYRQRLRIYRPFMQPSRRTLLKRLNGPGAPSDPNHGLPAGTGVTARFLPQETPNDIAVAISLVSNVGDQVRVQFLEYLRAVYMVEAGSPVPAERFIPTDLRTAENDLRTRLAQQYTWPAKPAVAPALAAALDRVARCRAALGETAKWVVSRAQDPAGGSRYELGLGVDLTPPSAAELDRLAQQLAGAGPAGSTDQEIRALLAGLSPQPASNDPQGRWLLAGCGMRTVHLLGGGDLYLSHLPTSGMVITRISPPIAPAPEFEVRYHAPGDPGSNAVLLEGLASAAEIWATQGHTPWITVAPANVAARWNETVAVADNSPTEQALRSAGLPVVEQPNAVVPLLALLPADLIQTIELPAPLAQGFIANSTNAVNEVVLLLQTLREAGLSSALALVTGAGAVLLVVGVIGLPLAGINLGPRRATGFRWYAVRLQPPAGGAPTLTPVGSRAKLAPGPAGLFALVVLGYARRGGTDPYECRIELPPGALLNLRQYEYLMNLLDHLHPAGVEINTYPIRTSHVDLDGDGAADPLPPRLANHYRMFRRPRASSEARDPSPG